MSFAAFQVTNQFPLGDLPDDAVVGFFVGADIPGGNGDPFTSWPPRIGNDGQASMAPISGCTVDTSLGHKGVLLNGTTDDADLTLVDGPYDTGDYAVCVIHNIVTFPGETGADVVHSIGAAGSATDDKVLLAAETQDGGTYTIGPGSGNEPGHSRGLGNVVATETRVVTQIRRTDTTRRFLQDDTHDTETGAIADGHNFMWSFRYGSREDNNRHLNVILLALLFVDLSVVGATESQVVAAHTELGEHFGAIT